jgi:hypothetical protein
MYELWYLKIINIKNGNDVINANWYVSFSWFTKEWKQFIYWFLWEMWPNNWLYITLDWDFSKSKSLLWDNIFISGWYIDEKNIYVKTNGIVIDEISKVWTEKTFYKIIDIKTEKVIYSQEIK